MKLEVDADVLRPIVEEVVAEVLTAIDADSTKQDRRLGYPEREAAALLGVEAHVLRDARLRGEIEASLVGRRIVYTPEAIKEFLQRNRWRP